MKYILNEEYTNDFLTTQCGFIFKKGGPIDIPEKEEDMSHELQMYVKQKFIIPFTEKAEKIKADIEKKEKELQEEQKDSKIDKPKGVSTIFSEDSTLKSASNKSSKPNNPDEDYKKFEAERKVKAEKKNSEVKK
jgi:hypothetical protein